MPKYIDAEALKMLMVFSPTTGNLTVPEMRDILTIIDSAPSANVEPVRHGRWIINEINDDIRVLMCSCGFHEKRSTDLRIPRYCEQCGAKMDEEDDNENRT